MNELKQRIENETKKLIIHAEAEIKQAQARFQQAEEDYLAAKDRLERAKIQMAAAVSIRDAANTHIVLKDLKEGNLEN